ncbi:MAG: hypothetical protein FJ138_10345 [Deltaproteobacteria bacterium]|nr:hypothetical protein [Deltaproteobacteria bacterium]
MRVQAASASRARALRSASAARRARASGARAARRTSRFSGERGAARRARRGSRSVSGVGVGAKVFLAAGVWGGAWGGTSRC